METLFDSCSILLANMPKVKGSRDIAPELIDLVIKKSRSGESASEIARSLLMKRTTVYGIIKRNGLTSPKPGRTPKLSPQLRRQVARKARESPQIYATEIRNELCPQVSPSTVKRILNEAGLKNRVARRKPALTAIQKKNRLRFALEHAHKPLSFWHSILWSDESQIVARRPQRRRVWRPVRQALNPRYISGTQKKRASIMVWGCCSASGVGKLIHIETTMDSDVYIGVLERGLHASRQALRLPRQWLFMQDNDPKHTSNQTQCWLIAEGVEQLNWPANSPDLNPIEHLWEHLKQKFSGQYGGGKEGLFRAVERVWSEIPPDVIRNLVDSMPRRLEAVIKARGGNTKY